MNAQATCLCSLRLQRIRLDKVVDEQTKTLTDVATVLQEFDVESKSQVDPQPFFIDKELSLVPLTPFINTSDRSVHHLVKYQEELEGAVGYYQSDDENAIDGVVRLAAVHKAAAIFVSKLPQISTDLPVFKLTKGSFKRLTKNWKVKIAVLRPSSSAILNSYREKTKTAPESQFQATDGMFNNVSASHADVSKKSPVDDGDANGGLVAECADVDKDPPPIESPTLNAGHDDNILVDKEGPELPSDAESPEQTKVHSLIVKEDDVEAVLAHPLVVEGSDVAVTLCAHHSGKYGTSSSANPHKDAPPKGFNVVEKGRQHAGKKKGKSQWWFVKKVVNLWQSLTSPSLGEGLNSKDGWSQSGDYKSYKLISKKVKEFFETNDSNTEWKLEAIADQVYRLLVDTEGTLLHLVIAAQVTLCCRTKSTEDLKKETLRQLLAMKRIDENRPSRFDFNDGQWNPGPTFFFFLNFACTSKLDFGNDDDSLVTLFWFWIDCGLFGWRSDIDWEMVRSQVYGGFRQRAKVTLIASLGRQNADLLSFFLCTSLDDCMQTLLETIGDCKRIPYVDETRTDVLLFWISRRLKENYNDPEILRRLWTTTYDFLEEIRLVPLGYDEDKARELFITKIVSLSMFHHFHTFQLYVPLIEVAYPCHKDYDRWIKAVTSCISQDMRSSTFGTRQTAMVDVATLVDSEAFKRIQNDVVVESISWVSARMMHNSHFLLLDKVVYLGALHRMFASIQWKVQIEPKLQLLDLLRIAVKKEKDRRTVIEDCVRVAALYPGIFEGNPDSIQEITDVLLTVDDGKVVIVSKPFDLVPWEYFSTESSNSSGPLLTAILDRLPEVFYSASGSVSDYTGFYERVINSKSPQIILGKIASVAFCRMFQDWLPTSFPILAKESGKTLRSIFLCLSNSDLCEDELTNMKECAGSVTTLTERWREDFDADRVSGEVLFQISSCCQTDSWSVIAGFTSAKLPTMDNIRLKCDEFNNYIASIGRSTFLEGSSSSIQDILKGYNCYVDASTEIARIFKEYDLLFVRVKDSSVIPKLFGELSMQLCKVRDDAACAEAFRQENDQMIKLCDYFLRNSSVLFRKAVTESLTNKVNIEKLGEVLDCVKETIRLLFSPEAEYELVDDAVRVVVDAGSTLERELPILLESQDLKLTNAGVERFQMISLLTCYDTPLQGFINFCNKTKFLFVKSDRLFHELKKVSRQLLKRKGEPCDILKVLRQILCPKLGGMPSLKETQLELQRRQPVLKFVSSLSMNIEVWVLACEMDWVCRDGMKRFHDEYANITNVLLGSTETYEMKILDSLGTTIPAVAVLGSLTNAKTLESFLDQLDGNDDILRCRVDGDLSDLKQVQCNVSLIRDWFTYGVDEVAVVLEAVKASGEYHLNEVGKDVGRGIPIELVLRYTVTKDGLQSAKSMGGETLSNFIRNVGLIQHDDGGFIEQYRVIAKASQHYLEAVAAGYSNFSLKSFCCRAGLQWLTEARELLARIEAKACEFGAWMRRVRQMYPTALLFWNEELQELHQHVLTVASEHKDGYKDVNLSFDFIRQVTSRLISAQCNETDELLALKSALRIFNQNATHSTEGWLVAISSFVERLNSTLGSPVTRSLRHGFQQEQVAEIVLHTVDCGADVMNLAIQVLMQKIYSLRLPEEYEVLDCIGNHISAEKLSIFLHRCLMFPGSTFLVLHADDLEGRLMEKLLSFLSCYETACAGIRFHCVQRQNSILHTAPWVEGKTWDSILLDVPTLNFCSDLHPWKQLVADRAIHLSIVCSENSGSGKSYHILDQLKRIKACDGDALIASITLHEGTTIHSLTSDLFLRFPPGSRNRVVHFSFMYMPESHSGSVRWLEDVNHFFFAFLILGCVHDPSSPLSFHRGKGTWQIFVELPYRGGVSAVDWLWHHIPVLASCGSVHEPKKLFAIDDEARRVCTYLRAYDNGTINRKFTSASKQIMFVLDVSGSMATKVGKGKSAWKVARKNALMITESHIHPGDTFGVLAFDHNTYISIPLQKVMDDDHKKELCWDLCHIQVNHHGGTKMYHALQYAVTSMQQDTQQDTLESWIICLTDGATADTDDLLRASLTCSPPSLHVVVVGVNLPTSYEAQMRLLCSKYNPDQTSKGFFVPTAATLVAMNQAFQTVASRIPVSQTFQNDGRVSDEDCHVLIKKYAPLCLPKDDMLLLKFWIRFLFRRVRVFDENKSFNYNEEYEELGTSLMEMMLEEVERLLETHQSRDWVDTNHTQLIYDFSSGSPEFRLICTSPESLDEKVRQKLERLNLPGFSIPTSEQLRKRSTIERFLSQALDVPLQRVMGVDQLPCISDNGFILTLDFTMKILNIHERVECRIPCIIEGETGVSKTALTKMYAILRNSSLQVAAEASTQEDLNDICQTLSIMPAASALGGLHHALQEAAEQTIGNKTDMAGRIHHLVMEKCKGRSALFQQAPTKFTVAGNSETKSVAALLNWFGMSQLEPTFFEVNVDASLTETDIVTTFEEIRSTARKLIDLRALVVVFLDEINTSSVMGLFKEIVVDKRLRGEALEENIVVIAACNPIRTRLEANLVNSRENDLGKDWASGHYQVTALPASMAKLKWAFGALNRSQEKEFVFRRLEKIVGGGLNRVRKMVFTAVITESQEAMRTFAQKNIMESLKRTSETIPNTKQITVPDMEADAYSRAKSVVSLRDIQRVFTLYEFFTTDFKSISELVGPERGHQQNAMMLAIAIVYFLRLDSQSRKVFLDMIRNLLAKVGETTNLSFILEAAMNIVVRDTEIPKGIAITRGLKENIFMTLVCILSQIPLLIIGPPGSSKTLSVNVVSDNANGEDSSRGIYRQFARLTVFHYQCSKQSTSKEIATIFENATQRQEQMDTGRHRCIVFMDEAGLPEEERESLKVLHYLLEGHMSAKAKVGFVGISNHALDAAKSNRCITLLRQEPDEEEMLSITTGVLFGSGRVKSQVKFGDESLFDADNFCLTLSSTYTRLLHDKVKFDWFETFFGLRDYVYFLKALRRRASVDEALLFILTHQSFLFAIERNFNGIEPDQLYQICSAFLFDLTKTALTRCLRHPIDVLAEATTKDEVACEVSERARFKLIIDCTDDDSIMRLLGAMDVVDLSSKSLFMLSKMPEEKELEQLKVVSGVKSSALYGKLAVLSQTEEVNECFYDLFNQHFRAVQGRNGKISLFANIAVGGVSRRSLVRQEFECIVHVRASQLDRIPAPFLNRFEKYRLRTSEVLSSGCRLLGNLSGFLLKAQKQVARVVSVLDRQGLFGFVDEQTIDSLFIDMIPKIALTPSLMLAYHDNANETSKFVECLFAFISKVVSQPDLNDHIEAAIVNALVFLPADLSNLLQQLLSKSTIQTDYFWKCLGSLVNDSHDVSQMVKLLGTLFQMVATRIAAFRLMQIATPEYVFYRRKELPADLVHEYFNQEHFSLKKLIAHAERSTAALKDTKMLIVSTRSDAIVNRIPSYSTESDNSIEVIKAVVHDNPNLVVVEHLEALRSESMLRSSLIGWIENSHRSTYVLIVDMGNSGAIDRTNFVRMFLEQTLDPRSGKVVVLLLHFPQSSGTFYPALFLGRWQHFFLDGFGQFEHNAGVDKFIELACLNRNESDAFRLCDDRQLQDISERLENVLPRVLSHVAAKKILHPDQRMTKDFKTGHSARCDFLSSLMKRRVGGQTVGKLLCDKFGHLWLRDGLDRTIRKASERLCAGTTNLSLSMSLQSSLLETFDTFVSLQLCEMNHGRNLDIMLQEVVSQETEELFGLILQSLPVVPFGELVLRRREGCVVRGLLVTERRKRELMKFPFFDFVASCLSEVVEAALKDFSQGSNIVERDSRVDKYCQALHGRSYELLHVKANDQSIQIQRRKSAFQAVEYVRSAKSKSPSLFSGYVDQVIEKIAGTMESKAPSDWLRSEIIRLGFEQDILAIHVVSKVRETQLLGLASWSNRFAAFPAWSSEIKAEAEYGQMGRFFFNRLLEYFEANLLGLSRQEWKSSFSLFFHESVAMLAHNGIPNERQTRQMRVLCFFYAVANASTSDVDRNLLRRWYDTKSRTIIPTALEHLSLFEFVAEGGCNDVVQVSLWLFFSPTWMKLTTSFRDNDFKFLIEMITCGELIGNDRHMAVSLLRIALSSFGASTRLLGLQSQPLQLVANTIVTSTSAEFAENGERISVSHFVPDWLQCPNDIIHQAKRPACKNLFGVFFADCTPCFRCELSRVMFTVMLRGCQEQTESWTSDTMLMSVIADIEDETECNRQEFTRLARTRAAGGAWESFKGTPVASMGIAARLVCFVAKVAQELASTGHSSALSGTHFETSRSLFEGLMSIDFLRWDDFFIGTILRLRGEGTLAKLLKPGGALSSFDWCRKWANGEPASMQGLANKLAKAERDLAEATSEEERKGQEFRLCPYCSQEFIVGAQNCGLFICGRDYHSQSQPVGCGQEFQIDQAPRYTTNERVLAPLRERIQRERTRLQASQEGFVLWTRARKFVIPILDFHAVKTTTAESMVPTAFVIPPHEEIGGRQATNFSLFRLLECSTSLAEKLEVLPDLIELYVWLHSTFNHLVTIDRALSLAMDDVVTKERLRCRFDLVHADHIEGLWRRLKKRFEQLLELMEYKVQWQCQELSVPFKKLEDARLIQLLSECDDPSEGNDYLFLVINHIIDQYNTFIRRLSELELGKNGSLPEVTIHPKFVMPGYGGASLISTVPVLSRFELKTLVEGGWNEAAGAFDMDLLRKLLQQQLFLNKLPPPIKNPMMYLREKFVFRDDAETNLTCHQATGGVSRNEQGEYFANMQDFTLYSDVSTLLREFNLFEGKGDLNRTLQDQFYNFSYDQLRSCLEGLRNFLRTLQTAGATSIRNVGEALCRVVNFSKEELTLRSKFGFPAFSNPQKQLILSLSGVQLVDFTHFVGHQLATEAYVFASLPLCLTEPLSESDRTFIMNGLQALNMEEGIAKTEERLAEFVRDVLSFYESEICKKAMCSGQRIRAFLLEMNCCDESDAIFKLLPRDLTVRKYIALRQLFHQAKLEMRFNDEASAKTESDGIDGGNGVTTKEAVSWLWNEEQDGRNSQVETEPSRASYAESLWFETTTTTANNETHDNGGGEIQAFKIQRWWRQVTNSKKHGCFPIESKAFRVLGQGGRMEWDAFSKKRDNENFPAMNIDSSRDDHEHESVMSSWTYESLCHGKGGGDNDDDGSTNGGENTSRQLYGSTQDEAIMRRWLNDHKIPQLVGDYLVSMGVRELDDIALFLEEEGDDAELNGAIARLDLIKLKRAIQSQREIPPSLNI